MSILVFNRFESKYKLDDSTFQVLLQKLMEHMEWDPSNVNEKLYAVSSLYFDTMANDLIRHSIANPRYKEKLRIRAYGVPGPADKVYLELKKKVRGLVNKRRIGLTAEQAQAFVMDGARPKTESYIENQVVDEIEYFLSRFPLVPKVYIAYERFALFSRNSGDLRITFDCNLRARRDDLRLESGDHGKSLMGSGEWLMEVKTSNTIPLWLARILSDLRLWRVSYSKYGNEYVTMIKQQRAHERGNTNV